MLSSAFVILYYDELRILSAPTRLAEMKNTKNEKHTNFQLNNFPTFH